VSPEDVKLSISIMHAPWSAWRRGIVAAQTKVIRGAPGVVRFSVVKDVWREGFWRTARACLEESYRAPGATHHLILQDDAELCRDFVAGVRAVVAARPNDPIDLFCARKEAAEAEAHGVHWAELADAIFGLAIVYPVAFIPKWIAWDRAHVLPTLNSYDTRLRLYCGCADLPVAFCVPSLVEHIHNGPGAHRERGVNVHTSTTTAVRFLKDRSPLEIDWTKGASTPVRGGSFKTYLKANAVHMKGI